MELLSDIVDRFEFLLVSDIHLTDNPNDEYRWELFSWIHNQFLKWKFSYVLILGDITDKKDNHSSMLVNRIAEEFKILANDVPVIILKGNHDYVLGQSPFFQFLRHFKGQSIRFIDRPTEISSFKDKKVLFLPHTRTPLQDWEGLSFKDYDFVFIHQTVDGAVASNGQKMVGELTADFFDGAKFVYSGDIHVPQKIGQVTYVGSPYHVHFGDKFTPRVILLDEDGGRTNLKFETLQRFTADIKTPSDISTLGCRPGDQIKIRLAIRNSDLASWPKLRQECTNICTTLQLNVKAIELNVIKGLTRVRLNEMNTTLASNAGAASPASIIKSYSETNQLDEELVNTGLRIINKE